MNAETPINKPVTIHEAKTHLSRLIARVEAGGEVIIARGQTPVAKLVALDSPPQKRRIPGRFAHMKPPGSKGILESGFWDPLTDEEMGIADRDNDPLSPNWQP